jgi:Zn-dependent protease with chaperone function
VLRLLPTGSACLLALLVAVAFARHEPHHTGERAGPMLLAAAALGGWLVLVFAWRAISSLVLTSRLLREWEKRARPIVLPGAPAPTRRLDDAFPVVAVVGVLRPRLFLAASVLDRLSPAELRAVLDHERAHLDRRDNLKRWLLRSCPDLPGLGRLGEGPRREWEEASEAAADDRAALRNRRAGTHLASALVKVASLSPRGARLTVSATALLSESNLRGRVERLLARERSSTDRPSRLGWMLACAVPALLVAVAGLSSPLRAIHSVLETVVHSLS